MLQDALIIFMISSISSFEMKKKLHWIAASVADNAVASANGV